MAGGDDDFDEFFRKELSSVVATVHRITGDGAGAEEIAQDAFVRALVRWRRLRHYDRPGAWVRRVAIRDAVRAAQRSRRFTRTSLSVLPVAPAASSDDELLAAVHALPAQQRAAIVLYYLEDRPTPEVSDLLGCSEATVRSHLRRARRRLAEALGSDEEGALRDVSG